MLGPFTEEFLSTGNWDFPGVTNKDCQGARFHSPTPLFTTQIPLVPLVWSAEAHQAAPMVWLCGTCAANLYILQQMLYAAKGELTWQLRREFGNDLRALAQQGWRAFADSVDDQPDTAREARRGEED